MYKNTHVQGEFILHIQISEYKKCNSPYQKAKEENIIYKLMQEKYFIKYNPIHD
jgi:hypothetical protein